MLEKYSIKPQTVDRIRANWLAEPIGPNPKFMQKIAVAYLTTC
jgi:hypothetical protein